MKARSNKYMKLRKETKKLASRIFNMESCPLGIMNEVKYNKALEKFESLPLKMKNLASKLIEYKFNQYYKPVVQGRNGEWYSAADMDDMMAQGAF